jgi:hypothetical protein
MKYVYSRDIGSFHTVKLTVYEDEDVDGYVVDVDGNHRTPLLNPTAVTNAIAEMYKWHLRAMKANEE